MYLDLHREHARRCREYADYPEDRDDPDRIAQEWDGWWTTPQMYILNHDADDKSASDSRKRRLSGKALRINQAPAVVPDDGKPLWHAIS